MSAAERTAAWSGVEAAAASRQGVLRQALAVDEAWSFFRADEILGDLRPLDGMNYYTGAIHHYLLAAGVKIFGLHAWVVRLISGTANVGMLLACMHLVRRWHPGEDTWLWTGALCMSSATFVGLLSPQCRTLCPDAASDH